MNKQTANVSSRKERLTRNTKSWLQSPKELSWERNDGTAFRESVKFSGGALENDISAVSNNLLTVRVPQVRRGKNLWEKKALNLESSQLMARRPW